MFNGKTIKAVLLDITGVLTESTKDGSRPIDGSAQAVQKILDAGIEVRFVTNETQKTRRQIQAKLHQHGFTMKEEEIFPPALAMAKIAKDQGLTPHFLVHPEVMPDFAEVSNSSTPDCVVLGDAVDNFSYANLNKAFLTIIKAGTNKCQLFSLGKGRFYQEDGELTLDVGPFTAAIEYATGCQAKIVGKPSRDFFMTALSDVCDGQLTPNQAVMVGDDIVSDVGGAQKCGFQGVLVRTGKFRPSDEKHPEVKPDMIVNNLSHFADVLLA